MIKDKLISPDSRAHFVNDGSLDNTWEILKQDWLSNPLLEASSLSRNFGHQSAILAGMYDNDADIYVTIDADLQDNPDCIIEMVQKINSGCDIVYGVRKKRDSDSWFKRVTAQGFYSILSFLEVHIRYNHDDFRMITPRAVETVTEFTELTYF